MQVLAHLTIRIFEITCPQNSQGSTWRVGSDSSPQSFSPQKVRLESYDFCQWILSASGKCDMGHGIIQAARCNTYLLHKYVLPWFQMVSRGKYILYT